MTSEEPTLTNSGKGLPLVDVYESYRTSGQNSYTSRRGVEPERQIRPTRRKHVKTGRKKGREHVAIDDVIRQDAAFQAYDEYRPHKDATLRHAAAAVRMLLNQLNIPITQTALTELIAKSRQEHRQDIFAADDALRRFVNTNPVNTHRYRGGLIKGIFEANHCPLNVSITQHKAKRTMRIPAGILKAIYDSLPREELKLIADYCAHVTERVDAICARTPISAWEDFDDQWTIIRFDPQTTKVFYEHIGILPKQLADRIRQYAKEAGRYPGAPFPNHEQLWTEITNIARTKFGVNLTSKYCRKEYVAKAKKTAMPPNDWDFLAGHKQQVGNQAHHYDPEDDKTLVKEYAQYLAPYLGLGNTKQPDDAPTILSQKPDQSEIIKELQEQILQLTKLLTQAMSQSANQNAGIKSNSTGLTP